jgi:hypothetical protein
MVELVVLMLLAGEPLRWQTRHVKEIVPGCGDRKNGCACVEVTTVYVISGPAAARKAINDALNVGQTARDQVRTLFAGFQDMRKAEPKAQRWFDATTVHVMLSTERVFSVQVSTISYTGGAHPNPTTTYRNFDSATGEEFGLEDILKDGALPKFTEIAARHFALDGGTDQEFCLTDNFGLDKRGLILSWNPYDLGPRSATATIEIPYAEIKELLKPGILP